MTRKFLTILVFLLTMGSPAIATDQLPPDNPDMVKHNTTFFGIGWKSCAYWLSSPETEEEGRNWILGYWSGLNSARWWDSEVGSDTDIEGIFAEIKHSCNASPSQQLWVVTNQLYTNSERTGVDEQRQKIRSGLCPKN